jgi:hypothetical protein
MASPLQDWLDGGLQSLHQTVPKPRPKNDGFDIEPLTSPRPRRNQSPFNFAQFSTPGRCDHQVYGEGVAGKHAQRMVHQLGVQLV